MRADDERIPCVERIDVFNRMYAFFREFSNHAFIVDDIAVGVYGAAFSRALLRHLDGAAHTKAESAVFR